MATWFAGYPVDALRRSWASRSWLVAIALRLGAAGMRMGWVLAPGRLRSAITPPQALIPGMAGASAFYVPIDAVIVSQPGGRSLGNAKSSR